MLDKDICGHVRKMEVVMKKRMEELVAKHNGLRQGRVRGLFGAVDIVDKDGQLVQKQFSDPVPEKVVKFKQRLLDNGVFSWVRSPLMHFAPPLIITVDDAMTVLDH